MKKYTIISAKYANADHTVIEGRTEERGAVIAAKEYDRQLFDWFVAHPGGVSDFVEDPAFLVADIKAECQRRIYAVIDQIAQINLAAAAAGGVLTTNQVLVYRAGLTWIELMRIKCGELVSDSDQTFAEDRHWPVPSAAVVVLAEQF